MGKIILITFAFMGFALYEISGGDAFVPIAEEKRAALAIEQAEKERMLAAAKAEKLKAEQEQAQASVVLASAVVTTAPKADIKTDEMVAAVSAALDVDKAEEIAQGEAEVIEDAPAADIREVTAARVNMRNGPGQKFNVVAKLTSGEKVEILQDPGDGWVKLRVAESGRVGWMADFLLTASNSN